MPRRIALTVNVDLDSVPGSFHTEDDARSELQGILDRTIPHYHPGVSLYVAPPQPDPNQGLLPLGDWKVNTGRGRPNWVKEEYFNHPLQDQKPEGD